MSNLDLKALERLCLEMARLKKIIDDYPALKFTIISEEDANAIAACIVKLGKENVPLRQFVEYCLDQYSWFNEPDGGDLQEKAIELGLVELRPIDPEDSIDEEDEHYFCKWTPDNRKERG